MALDAAKVGSPPIATNAAPYTKVVERLEAATAARCEQRLVSDGGRLLPSAKRSDVDFLGDAQSVIELDTEVANRAVDLCVTEQKLNRAQIAGFPVDHREKHAQVGPVSKSVMHFRRAAHRQRGYQ